MKKILLFFTLLFLGNVAFAEKAPDVLNPEAVSRYTDMSIYYLSQLFGTVGNVLVGGEAQMMGKLFYQLNWGIFLITSIIIFYAVMMGTLKLASEGVTMQPGKSALFSLAKLSLGISLVIPSAATGYCVMQQIVMYVVVKGVGMADSIWAAGLDYLKEGGTTWQYRGSGNTTDVYTKLLNQENRKALLDTDKLAPQIFQNAVCMIGSRERQSTYGDLANAGGALGGTYNLFYDVQEDTEKRTFNFPGLNDNSVAAGSSCGKISWEIKDSCTSSKNSAAKCAITRAAVSKLIYALMPAARQYYCYKSGGQGTCAGIDSISNYKETLAPYLISALIGYYSTVKAFADMSEGELDQSRRGFVDNAKRDGWIVAGRYYWDIMRLARTEEGVSQLDTYATTLVQAGPTNASTAGNLKDIIAAAKTDFNLTYKSQEFSRYLDGVTTDSGRELTQRNSGWIIHPGAIVGVSLPVAPFNPGLGATLFATTVGINYIGKLFNDWSSYKYNPIQFLYKVGQECIKLTLVIWIAGGALIAGFTIAWSVCAASNPMGYGSQAVVEWVKPILMMIATMLWMAGFFLCYYVPLYPFMVFLFASFGWFISVIEAMVAAPLVALGLAHPDSHDLLGKSEQAIMLLLSVFIQPSLLVIGLIGGIILSYVSFELLIYTFSAFIGDVMTNSGSAVQSTTDIVAAVQSSALYNNGASLGGANILVAPVLLIVFCVLTYTLLTQSFSLVYLLRDNVMKWIGAPTTGVPSVEQMLSDTRGAISQGGSRTGEAGSSSVSGGLGTSSGVAESINNYKGGQKGNQVTVPGGGKGDGAGGAGGAAGGGAMPVA